ncbi:hypothetical protein BH23GEM9_BH23GEM9_28750 [soil metagenome]
MDPVPYEIREDDIDEVISAYESVGGGDWTREERAEARRHVMSHIIDLNDTVRSAPEDRRLGVRGEGLSATDRAMPVGTPPGHDSTARREAALAAIEDLLIRDGFIELGENENRVFPVVGGAGGRDRD